jgi:hypothetical protein
MQIIYASQNPNLTPSAKFFFPYKMIFPDSRDQNVDIFEGDIIFSTVILF